MYASTAKTSPLPVPMLSLYQYRFETGMNPCLNHITVPRYCWKTYRSNYLGGGGELSQLNITVTGMYVGNFKMNLWKDQECYVSAA